MDEDATEEARTIGPVEEPAPLEVLAGYLDDDEAFRRPQPWWLDARGLHHTYDRCAHATEPLEQQDLSLFETFDSRCRGCHRRMDRQARANLQAVTRLWTAAEVMKDIGKAVTSKNANLDELADLSSRLTRETGSVRRLQGSDFTGVQSELMVQSAKSRAVLNQALWEKRRETHEWSCMEGPALAPWGDAEPPRIEKALGHTKECPNPDRDTCSGIYLVRVTWLDTWIGSPERLNDPETPERMAELAEKLLPGAENARKRVAMKPAELKKWRADAAEVIKSVVGKWIAAAQALRDQDDMILFGLTTSASTGIGEVNAVLERCVILPNSDGSRTAVVAPGSAASLVVLCTPTYAQYEISSTIPVSNLEDAIALWETASVLWDSDSSAGAYADLADAIDAARALDK